MSERIGDADEALRDALYRCLSHPFRRQILATVADREGAVETGTLATQLEETNAERDDGSSATGRTEIRTALVHVHLPMLADAELVDWDRGAGTVSSGDRSPVREWSESPQARVDADWDTVATALSKRRRQIALSVASERSDPVGVETIAEEIADHESADGDETVSVEEIRISLHHHHLPTLDDAGLVEYDADDHTVVYRSHPYVEDVWVEKDADYGGRGGPTLVRAPL